MRVLLAVDGSPSSDAACQLVASISWPEGSVIQIVGVVPGASDEQAPSDGSATATKSIGGRSETLARVLDGAVASLQKPTLIVRKTILAGRPGTLIVDAAVRCRAELLVVGSRGLGPLKAMLLGSVSAEVVDHASCPVLVVRGPTIGHILLAVDGSASATAAVAFLSGVGFMARDAVEVLTVVAAEPVLPPLPPESASRGRAAATAAAAAESLRSSGVPARWSISKGNPAHEIIEAARTDGSDLIVLGSRGHTGLTRIVLGSVARNVLLHSDVSVLIVHEPLRARSAERVDESKLYAFGEAGIAFA